LEQDNAMATNREILFVLKMRNEASGAIRQLAEDLRALQGLQGRAGNSGNDGTAQAADEQRAAVTALTEVTRQAATVARETAAANVHTTETIHEVATAAREAATDVQALSGASNMLSNDLGNMFSDFDAAGFRAELQRMSADALHFADQASRITEEVERATEAAKRWYRENPGAFGPPTPPEGPKETVIHGVDAGAIQAARDAVEAKRAIREEAVRLQPVLEMIEALAVRSGMAMRDAFGTELHHNIDGTTQLIGMGREQWDAYHAAQSNVAASTEETISATHRLFEAFDQAKGAIYDAYLKAREYIGLPIKPAINDDTDATKRNTKAKQENASAWSGLRRVAALAMTYLGGRALIRAADEWKTLSNQIRSTTTSEGQMLAVRERSFEIAQRTNTAMSTVVSVQTKVARATMQLGRTQNDALKITETLFNAMQVGGASTEQAASAATSFAVALQRGSMRAQQMQAVLKQSPELVAAIDRAMGKQAGTFEKMLRTGKITVSETVDYVLSAYDEMAEKAGALPMTVGQGVELVKNAWLKFVGSIDEATGATDGLGQLLRRIAAIISSPEFIQGAANLANIIGGVLLRALNDVVAVVKFFASDTAEATLATHALAAAVGLLVSIALYKWIMAAKVAIILLFNTIRAHPIGALLVVLGMLIAVLISVANRTENGIKKWDQWMATLDVVGENFKAFGKMISEVWAEASRTIIHNAGKAADALAALGRGELKNAASYIGEMTAFSPGAAMAAYSDTVRDGEARWQAHVDRRTAQRAAADAAPAPDFDSLNDAGPGGGFAENDQKKKAAKDKAKEFLKSLREWIDDTKHAIAQQREMNTAILDGAAAVRRLSVEQAGANALREKEKAALEAGVRLTTGQKNEIRGLAEEMERVNQEGAFNQLIAGIQETVREIGIETEALYKGLQVFGLRGEAQEEFEQQMRVEARVRQMMQGITRAQYASEEQYLARITQAREDAYRAAVRIEDAMTATERAKAGRALADSGRRPLEVMREEYAAAQRTLMEMRNAATLDPDGNVIKMVFDDTEIRRAQEAVERLRPPADLFDAARQGFRNFMDELKPSILEVRDLVKGVANKMTDAFVELATTGKTSFRELAQSIIQDIMRMMIRALMFKAIMAGGNAIFGPGFGEFMSAAGVGKAAVGGGSTGMAAKWYVGVDHKGGLAGASNTVRSVDPSIFSGAKRYHKGGLAGMKDMLRPGEVPIIAEQGEAVLPTVRLPDGSFGVRSVGGGNAPGGNSIFAPNININLDASGGGSGPGMDEETQRRMAAMLEEELNVHLQRKLEEWTRVGGPLAGAVRR
jgi:tape measure domain-containing protein